MNEDQARLASEEVRVAYVAYPVDRCHAGSAIISADHVEMLPVSTEVGVVRQRLLRSRLEHRAATVVSVWRRFQFDHCETPTNTLYSARLPDSTQTCARK